MCFFLFFFFSPLFLHMAAWKLKVSCDFSFSPCLFLVLGLKPSSELLVCQKCWCACSGAGAELSSGCCGAGGCGGPEHWHRSFRAFGVHGFPESCRRPNELFCLFLQDVALLEYQHHSRDYASHLPPGSIMQPQRRRPSLLSEFQPGNERYRGLLPGRWAHRPCQQSSHRPGQLIITYYLVTYWY